MYAFTVLANLGFFFFILYCHVDNVQHSKLVKFHRL